MYFLDRLLCTLYTFNEPNKSFGSRALPNRLLKKSLKIIGYLFFFWWPDVFGLIICSACCHRLVYALSLPIFVSYFFRTIFRYFFHQTQTSLPFLCIYHEWGSTLYWYDWYHFCLWLQISRNAKNMQNTFCWDEENSISPRYLSRWGWIDCKMMPSWDPPILYLSLTFLFENLTLMLPVLTRKRTFITVLCMCIVSMSRSLECVKPF